MSDCNNEFDNLVALLYVKYDTLLIKDPQRYSFVSDAIRQEEGEYGEPEEMLHPLEEEKTEDDEKQNEGSEHKDEQKDDEVRAIDQETLRELE